VRHLHQLRITARIMCLINKIASHKQYQVDEIVVTAPGMLVSGSWNAYLHSSLFSATLIDLHDLWNLRVYLISESHFVKFI